MDATAIGANAGEPLKIAHGFGANLGAVIAVFGRPFLAASPEMGDAVADALGTKKLKARNEHIVNL